MNGYFQVIFKTVGVYLRCYPPTEDGRPINFKEVLDYLEAEKLPYDLKVLSDTINGLVEEQDVLLTVEKILPIKERCMVNITFDKMKANICLYPPSTDGKTCTLEDIESALRLAKVEYGVDEKAIRTFLENKEYGTPCTVAQGKPPREGSDAKIEYFFKTDRTMRPQVREDGTVNYFELDLVSHCKKGDLLAVLTPADLGEPGINVLGAPIRQKEVVRMTLKHGNNIEKNEEKTELRSAVDGHVTLVDDTVFVSNVLEVENVDNSTGNIDYDGSVKINGNVCTNFSVRARGDIEVKGTVEGAYMESGNNIVLARGINGMGKGKLVAEGNVISKFLENCSVTAGGYVETETIVQSNVKSKTEIHVSGKNASIIGGTVIATNLITTKNLGTPMGTATNIVVGVDPAVSERSVQLKKELDEAKKNLDKILPVLESTKKKLLNSNVSQKDQMKYMSQLIEMARHLQQVVESRGQELSECKKLLTQAMDAKVEVSGELCPGVVVTISDVSITIRDSVKFCCLRKRDGAVKVESL